MRTTQLTDRPALTSAAGGGLDLEAHLGQLHGSLTGRQQAHLAGETFPGLPTPGEVAILEWLWVAVKPVIFKPWDQWSLLTRWPVLFIEKAKDVRYHLELFGY